MRNLCALGCLALLAGLIPLASASEDIVSPCAHLPAGFFQNEKLKSRNSGSFQYPADSSGSQEAFVVGGQNRLDDLLHLETIAGSKIVDLEKRMQSHGHGHVMDYHPMFKTAPWKGVSHPALRASSGGFLGVRGGEQLDAPSEEQRKMVEGLSGKAIQDEIHQLAADAPWLSAQEREGFRGKLPMIFAADAETRGSMSFEQLLNNGIGAYDSVDVSLKQLLIRDELKTRQLGANHQEIAAPLLSIIDSFEKQVTEERVQVPLSKKIKVGDKEYTVEGHSMANALSDGIETERSFRSGWREGEDYPGVQGSPFCDGLFASWYMKITDENGKELWIDALTPHLIHRYGFYQGGKYRVPPEDIAAFFKLGKAGADPVQSEGVPQPVVSPQSNQHLQQ